MRRAYDGADLSRAVEAYRFFFPTVTGMAIFKGSEEAGQRFNRRFGLMRTGPEHQG